MPLTDYQELLLEVQEYLARPDLSTNVPGFVRLAEIRIERESKLRHRWTEGYTPGLTMVGGQDYVDLPAGAKEVRWIRINTSPPTKLDLVGPEMFDRVKWNATGGVPSVMIMRGLQIALAPTPIDPHGYDILFYKGIPPLTEAVPTNYLMTNAPDVLLYGSLLESAPFLGDDERIGVWGTFFDRALKSFNHLEARARLGGGPLRMRADNQPGAGGRHVPTRGGP